MKKSIVIIGNSHVAALKKGWSTLSSKYPNTKIKFYAAKSSVYKEHPGKVLTHKGDKAVPLSSELTDSFKLTSGEQSGAIRLDIDRLVYCGFTPRIRSDFAKRYSLAVLELMIHRSLSRGLFGKTYLPAFNNHSFQQIFIPPPAFASLTDDEQQAADYPVHFDIFRKCLQNTLAKQGVELVVQPVKTLAENSTTLNSYSVGSTKLSLAGDHETKHRSTDRSHMNGRFGEEMLAAILKDCD